MGLWRLYAERSAAVAFLASGRGDKTPLCLAPRDKDWYWRGPRLRLLAENIARFNRDVAPKPQQVIDATYEWPV